MSDWAGKLWNAIPKEFRIPLAGLGIVLLLLVALAAMASYQPHEYPGTYETQPEGPSAHVPSDDRLADYTFWLMILTGVLAGGTLALWYVTWRTLDHAQQTSERELRAYVDVKEVQINKADPYPRDDGQTGRRLHATVLVKNYGKTPALELTTWAHRAYRLAAEGEQPPGIPSYFEIASPRSLAPGASYTHQLVMDITETQYRALDRDNGAATFWVWGEIRYKDAFGAGQEVDFRFFVGGPTVERKSLPYMARAKTGNRTT